MVIGDARIEEAGGTVTAAPDPTVVDLLRYFRDPAGNLLGYDQQRGLK